MFKALVEKMDMALSEGTGFDEIAGNLKKLHIKVKDEYVKPLPTDLCSSLLITNWRTDERMDILLCSYNIFIHCISKNNIILVG